MDPLQLVPSSISAQPSLCPVALTSTSCEPGRVQRSRRPHLPHPEERKTESRGGCALPYFFCDEIDENSWNFAVADAFTSEPHLTSTATPPSPISTYRLNFPSLANDYGRLSSQSDSDVR